ncbi:hypothetical protein MSAN_01197600 [Mycena sanguinolenta]|uniref:Transmembrane protein n=1 Tax=Mycena sanguinolenta TaxID=230812 RepID=A0A8H6YH30_9AGAR|nr:hypothetical protein MSAN_01197600 [Mycena sanguinolenta]
MFRSWAQQLALPSSCWCLTTISLAIMLLRAWRWAQSHFSWQALVIWTMFLGLIIPVSLGQIIGIVLDTISHFQDVVASQKKLRSLIADNTPISGWYGPGSWWAWLITLGMTSDRHGCGNPRRVAGTGERGYGYGSTFEDPRRPARSADDPYTRLCFIEGMTHAHSFVATAEPDEWDYDLIAASGYTIAAAIDVIFKAKTMVQLGESVCGSPTLPALLCAERAVTVGAGSSLFTIAAASYVGWSSGRRRVGVAIIPLVFVVVASCFSIRAHQAIFRTELCKLPDGSRVGPGDLLFAPVTTIYLITLPIDIYPSPARQGRSRSATAVLVLFIILVAYYKPSWPPLGYILAVIVLFPLAAAVGGALECFGIWVILWGILYIFAFFPQMGSFPLTGMSVMDMDQLATLLSIGFIAALRSGRHILKALRNRTDSSPSTHELSPLPNEA